MLLLLYYRNTSCEHAEKIHASQGPKVVNGTFRQKKKKCNLNKHVVMVQVHFIN